MHRTSERAAAYDVVIVGAGSAGSALAARLAARTELRIAIVEAGPDYGPRDSGAWPTDIIDAHHSPDSHDWGYEQSRARVVGGCSAHNECAIVRPLPGDFDRWAVSGWSDADLASIIGDVAFALPAHVCREEDLASWQRAFLDTAVEAGFPRLAHVDDAPGFDGVAPFIQNIADGVRWNAGFAFLDGARSRVTVISDFLADRLVIDGDRARALVGHGPDGRREVRAERFVLSGGVYGSPAILLRSGVGPATDLRDLGIEVAIDLPGVGANLHDHPGVALDYQPTPGALRAVKEDEAASRFYEAQIVLRASPDLHLVPYQSADDGAGWTFGIVTFHLDPGSRGRMRLTSRDADAPPSIDLGLLTDRKGEDAESLAEGIRLVHELTRHAPLASSIKRGPRRFASHDRVIRYVRENVSDYGHSVGTCRIGSMPNGGDVVDARGKVYGLANVFVSDASIVPRIPRANTNFTCFLIGTRIADLLASG
jgi:choline dehydrogenase